MRRVFATTAAVTCGAAVALPPYNGSSSSCSDNTHAPQHHTHRAVALLQQRCGLRNLHQYPHARYKSLVKDRHRFARNWWLMAGNNYELVEEVAHEREACENLARYRSDGDDAHRLVLSTSELRDLHPARRLDALVVMMRQRWRVMDGNRGMDKATMLLQALECFAELRARDELAVFAQLNAADQTTFLHYVDGACHFAQAAAHAHPDAVAVLVRAAQICDDMRCCEKRDEVLRMAEGVAKRLDRAYAFARPPSHKDSSNNVQALLRPPSYEEAAEEARLRSEATLRAQLADKPQALARVAHEQHERFVTPEFLISTRRHKVYMSPLRKHDMRRRVLLTGIARPEHDSWTTTKTNTTDST